MAQENLKETKITGWGSQRYPILTLKCVLVIGGLN